MRKFMMIIMAVALIALPTLAQDWQSTSTIQGSGSTYSSQVTGVGAAGVDNMATTTDSYSPANAPGLRKSFGPNQDGGQTGDPNSPVGDALIPLLLMALAFGGVTYIRRRKAA